MAKQPQEKSYKVYEDIVTTVYENDKPVMEIRKYDGTPIWKMIINDTWFDIKRKLKSNTK